MKLLQSPYKVDRTWADAWAPQVRAIIGGILVNPASLERDMHEATDLIVYRTDERTIACRVRRPGYLRYWDEFTIRSWRASGAKTELAKVLEGWADWMFYGHATETQGDIHPWYLLDLDVFRSRYNAWKGTEQRNWKDATGFRAFSVSSFPGIVIAESAKRQVAKRSSGWLLGILGRFEIEWFRDRWNEYKANQ